MKSDRAGLIEAPRDQTPLGKFASASDHATCRRLHKQYGSTYYLATQQLPAHVRRRVHALYAFVRIPDEWVDNPGKAAPTDTARGLFAYRNELLRGTDGVVPRHPVLRAFCDVVHEKSIPLDEPLRFLDAMEQDLTVNRYATYDDLRAYMRGSASAVGLMMCYVLDVKVDVKVEDCAAALGEAMQITNFLRDLGEDMRRGRIYIPAEDLRRFYGAEDAILREEVTPPFIDLMKFEIERARALYAEADAGIPLLPRRARKSVLLARTLYSRILDRIEERNYDVFSKRVRTSRSEKVIATVKVMLGLG